MKRLFNLFMLLIPACLIGCGGGDSGGGGQIVNTLNLSINKTSINSTASGTTTSFTVTSNVSWSVSATQTWVKMSPTGGNNDGTVEVTIEANPPADVRTATITVNGAGVSSKTISVTQDAAAASLAVSTETLKITAAGGTENVKITSNGSWSVSVPSDATWCKTNVSAGQGTSTLTITVEANSTSAARSADIVVKCSNVEKRIKVNQDAGVIIPSEGDNGVPATPAPKK